MTDMRILICIYDMRSTEVGGSGEITQKWDQGLSYARFSHFPFTSPTNSYINVAIEQYVSIKPLNPKMVKRILSTTVQYRNQVPGQSPSSPDHP